MTITETGTASSEVYYDPYDTTIDSDPYPVWRRLRDEAPLYRNEQHGFWALSRYADVEPCLSDWETYRSGKGSVLELIKASIEHDVTMPSGMFIFEDPPEHDFHRAVLGRAFTPRRMAALEARAREFCAHALDRYVGEEGFDFISDLGAFMPMRMIGDLLGIPEADQQAIRDKLDENLHLDENGAPNSYVDMNQQLAVMSEMFGDYIDWREKNPSDDLMTEVLNADIDDPAGTRKLTRDEVLTYCNLLAGAGNETTTRLIGWTGKVLSDFPDARREIAADRSLLNNAIEEMLRYEAPSPVQARYVAKDVEWHGQTVEEGSIILLLNGSANRDERKFADPDRYDPHRSIGRHLSFGYGLHHCLGHALARLEGRVALDEVLNRFPDWEVDTDRAVQARTSTVRGWETLPVRIR
jgi:cytochrome P450